MGFGTPVDFGVYGLLITVLAVICGALCVLCLVFGCLVLNIHIQFSGCYALLIVGY